MKSKILFLLMVTILIGCKKEKIDTPDDSGPAVVSIRISMDGLGGRSRGVEVGHPGSGTVNPPITAVTVYSYNDYGKLISQLDLTKDQRDAVLYGSGAPGAPGTATGAVIGLPVGTKKIDVVINNPSDKYTSISENINYYNYRQGEEPQVNGKSDFPAGTNFNRTFLTTDKYGVGYDISSLTQKNGIYEADFVVKPMLARFEIFNSINVKNKEEYKDNYKQSWKKINATNFLEFLKTENPAITKIDDALKPAGEVENKYGVKGPYDEKESELVTVAYYYIPANYWFVVSGGTTNPDEFVEGSVAEGEAGLIQSQWVKSPYYGKLTTTQPLQWYPNIYHAVDVEEIFVNNIKVRGAGSSLIPYLHPWPNADKANGWPHWYKAYHPYGWHTNGSSADNSFLCMGNMWDRIAESADKLKIDWQKAGLSVPGFVGGTDQLEMDVLTGKATPVTNKSGYGDANGSRNLGVATAQAAAYHFYPQEVALGSNKEVIANSLPHIILKVKCYNTPEDYNTGKAAVQKDFITIKLFSATAYNTDYLNKYERGKIYRINLEDVASLFKAPVPVPGSTPDYTPNNPVDPDPEMPGSQVNVKIQVLPWTIQNIFPGIQ